MDINYSVPYESKYFLYLDVSIRHGLRHVGLSLSDLNLSLAERVYHLVIGLIKALVPVLGHIITAVDIYFHAAVVRTVHLEQTDPYERGKEHGELLKEEVQELYNIIVPALRRNITDQQVQEIAGKIPEDFVQEMRGLADGAEVAYEDVLLIHTFLDISLHGRFGCSAIAASYDDNEHVACEPIAITNHSDSIEKLGYSGESGERKSALLGSDIDGQHIWNALESANVESTVQSMVFHPKKRMIELAIGDGYASSNSVRSFSSQEFFGEDYSEGEEEEIIVARNLDWQWYFLAKHSLLMTKDYANGQKVATITFPGYLGCLSGMNKDGLSVACLVQGIDFNIGGMPVVILLNKVLEECKNVDEALAYMTANGHGSSMNLIMADPKTASTVELLADGVHPVGRITA